MSGGGEVVVVVVVAETLEIDERGERVEEIGPLREERTHDPVDRLLRVVLVDRGRVGDELCEEALVCVHERVRVVQDARHTVEDHVRRVFIRHDNSQR